MKYYDTHFEEYILSVKHHNIHPELEEIFSAFPKTIRELGNLILYGPCGSGKYSQLLYLIERYSPSHLKYDKHITIHTEKQDYIYRISDIHYEIDMGLLGCHSKLLWHELFFQIVDIITMKPDKVGIFVCKNFHMIHSELLDVFYSYIQHCATLSANICVRFILITDHMSFIPNNILDCCEKIAVCKPSNAECLQILMRKDAGAKTERKVASNSRNAAIGACIESPNKSIFVKNSKTAPATATTASQTKKTREARESDKATEPPATPTALNEEYIQQISTSREYITQERYQRTKTAIQEMSSRNILNLKELHMITRVPIGELPKDIFNIVCDNIILEITNSHTLVFTNFRENLYDILIYNLDITECVWYILTHFIRIGAIKDATDILPNIYTFLKYYNNNYRPIYHLESILFYLLLEVRKQQKR